MHKALSTFDCALQRVRDLAGLYSALGKLTTAALDSSDLLRSQIVLVLSALDHFIHELTVMGMLEVYDGIRSPTPAYGKFQIPVGSFAGTPNTQLSRPSFEATIREKHSYLTFQRPDKIADAIRLFSEVKIWEVVANSLSADAKQLKVRIDLAVERRNKIAHEADIDPSYPGARWPISETDVTQVTELIEQVGHAIFQAVK